MLMQKRFEPQRATAVRPLQLLQPSASLVSLQLRSRPTANPPKGRAGAHLSRLATAPEGGQPDSSLNVLLRAETDGSFTLQLPSAERALAPLTFGPAENNPASAFSSASASVLGSASSASSYAGSFSTGTRGGGVRPFFAGRTNACYAVGAHHARPSLDLKSLRVLAGIPLPDITAEPDPRSTTLTLPGGVQADAGSGFVQGDFVVDADGRPVIDSARSTDSVRTERSARNNKPLRRLSHEATMHRKRNGLRVNAQPLVRITMALALAPCLNRIPHPGPSPGLNPSPSTSPA
ncbi:hypothetical protein T492DRAFT_834432 [Pavlovales sp. CCMP2436]|nr:hypothetical protein T492DRAFT_834432 [Pavlovales sp. CCMP2436]